VLGLARYLLLGQRQAVLVVALAAILALLLPPLSYLSGAALALVVLRIGHQAAMRVILWATLATAAVSWVAMASPLPALIYLLALWLPLWLLARLLATGWPLPRVLQGAALLGGVLVVGIHLFTQQPAAMWQQVLVEMLITPNQAAMSAEQLVAMQNLITTIASYMTGVMGAALLITLTGSLLWARWWQGALFNPGGFGEEFRQLRLGRPLSLVVLGGASIALMLGGLPSLITDLLLVVTVLLMLQGVAVAHALVKLRNRGRGWLVVLYLLLLFALPETALTLAVAGSVDNWIDFRRRAAGAA
jgi:hypothetical protein